MYYLCSENKGAHQLRICIYAKIRFSHDATQSRMNKAVMFELNVVSIQWFISVYFVQMKKFRFLAINNIGFKDTLLKDEYSNAC